MATVRSLIAVTTKHVVFISIELALVFQCLLEATARPVDSDLGVGQRTTRNFSYLRGGQPFEIVQDEGGAIVSGQAIDDTAYAGAHLVDNESISDAGIESFRLGSFVKSDDSRL